MLVTYRNLCWQAWLCFSSLSQHFEGGVPLSSGLCVLMRTQIIFVSCHPAYRSIFSPLWLLLGFSLSPWLLAIWVQRHKGMAYLMFILAETHRFLDVSVTKIWNTATAVFWVFYLLGLWWCVLACLSQPWPVHHPALCRLRFFHSSFLAFRHSHVSRLPDCIVQFQDSHLVPFFWFPCLSWSPSVYSF